MITYDFTGQTAIVTGGAQGIGGAVTKVLASQGARVAIWDMDKSLADDTAAQIGGGAFAVQVDISDWGSVQAAMSQTLDTAGGVQMLVNSAGVAGMNAPLADYPVEDFRKIIDINLMGAFYVNKAVVPAMTAAGYGRIVNIASVAGKEGNPNASAYSASKAAVIGLTKSLGKELASLDIAVNCVTPAAARTRIFDQMAQEHIDYMLSKIPRSRFLELNEAADMIVWLLSAENSFTTGATFDLSGGRATY
ncbi:SDR family NAD(P)-dependent oxidoreductase [Loktanella salsilacus]|uniref:SDR family NAD(P)-dependent oxidoreductase n=1 Tax=Loktanella salsilacus TaxID=195913 RepID=UPI003735DF1B